MKVLGIDPGLVVTGYGIIELTSGKIRLVEAGTIDSGDAQNPLPLRLQRIYDGLGELIDEHQPDEAALEQLYSHYAHPRTAILMGHARGVLCLAVGVHDIPLHHYAATQVKSSLTGNGRASKAQMQTMIQRTFGLPQVPEPPDVADALAIALCHLHHTGTHVSANYLRLVQ
ncbi:MAG: crossover junction endodeoxyribonuclease RuvC [Chloroflexota bacterium]